MLGPQGSCLAPLLSVVHINDLHLSLNHSEVNIYADHTSISYSSNSTSDGQLVVIENVQ